MRKYLDLLQLVLDKGKPKPDRTGVGTYSIFGPQVEFDLNEGFPLVTTRRIKPANFIYDVLWMLKGETNVKYLNDHGVHIWNPWADTNGDLGRIYGAQWCDWRTADGKSINQIDQKVQDIKNDPSSRRHIVSAWNPGEIDQMAIPNCCSFFQFNVDQGRLDLKLTQRSADLFLGVPLNIGQYALLTMMMAQVTGFKPGRLIQSFGDLHLYKNHINQARLQLQREPHKLPELRINSEVKNIHDFAFEDFELAEYSPHPAIWAPVNV